LGEGQKDLLLSESERHDPDRLPTAFTMPNGGVYLSTPKLRAAVLVIQQFERLSDALGTPNYSDDEIRPKVRNFRFQKPLTQSLTLEEKGPASYNREWFSKPPANISRVLFREVLRTRSYGTTSPARP